MIVLHLRGRVHSCFFSEGFSKGGIRQPVLYRPYPNYVKVLGLEQSKVQYHFNLDSACKILAQVIMVEHSSNQ